MKTNALRPTAPALLAAALLGLACPAAHAQEVSVLIPAQPLGAALVVLGQQTGLQISHAPGAVAGKAAPAVQGRFTPHEALDQLLAGSGLRYRLVGSNAVLVEAAPQAAVQPAPGLPQGSSESTLAPVRVEAPRDPSIGVFTVDEATLRAMPSGNGDVTSLLKLHPGVQFSEQQQRSGSQGEIAPADISINGAKFYANLYQLDGMPINNDINPASTGASLSGVNSNNSPPSASQGFAIDSSLICDVTVRDSNVPAAYGRFSGGVVSADTCAPRRSLGGRVSVEMTRSEWMQAKVAPANRQEYERSADMTEQPRFDKMTYRAAIESKVNDSFGFIGSFVRRTSEIPLTSYTGSAGMDGDSRRKVQQRQIDNLFLKGFARLDRDTDLDLSVSYAPSDNEYFISNARNSFFRLESGGVGLNAGLVQRFDDVKLTQRLTWSSMKSSRDGDASTWKLWSYSAADKNWGVPGGNSGEGGYGDINQQQDTLNYTARADLKPLTLLGMEHRLQAGIELERKESFYERSTQYEQYTLSTATTTCAQANGTVDSTTCSLAPTASGKGQYLKRRIIYLAGKFEVNESSQGAFIQDEIRYDRLTARLGLRYDDSNLASKGSLAPRSALFFDALGNGQTLLEAGHNRYYGRNFMQFHTFRERLSLQMATQDRNLVGGVLGMWGTPTVASTAAMYNIGDLDVPYSDETVLGVRQKWADGQWTLKRVGRKSRDEVVLHLRSAGNYWWDNVGKSDSSVWSLAYESLKPIQAFGTTTTVMGALDWTRVETSHANYADTLSDLGSGDLERMVRYDGKFIRWADRPADNYARPQTLRLLFNTYIPQARLQIGNFLRYRTGFQKMALNGKADYQGSQVNSYDKLSFGPALTWDTRINWSIPTTAGQEAFVTFTINNLLNRTNTLDTTSTSTIYEAGRQFWLELGYRF